MTAPVIALVAGFEAGDSNNYGFYDEAVYDTPTYAPDVIEHTITAYGRDQAGFTINRGVQQIVTQGFAATAATFSGVLANQDRRFDPNYLSGPYVENATSKVVPGVPLILRTTYNAITYTLFSGYVDDWPQEYPEAGKDQVVKLDATDYTAQLAAANLSITRGAEYSGARITAILDAVGYTGARSIAHGNTIVSALTRGTVSAMSHISDVTNAEWGQFYISAGGTVTFRGRDEIFSDSRSTTSQATFGDNRTTELSCKSSMISAPIYNRVVLTYSDTGSQVTSNNVASQNEPWGLRSLALSLPFSTAGQAQQYADWIVLQYANPRTLFASLDIVPSRGNGKTSGIDNLFPQAFGRELGDRITVKKTMTVGPRLSSECLIVGISHTYSDHVWSSTRFTLQDASFTQNLAYYDTSVYAESGSVYSL